MKISIIIPVYNVDIYLEKCLDSVLNQDIEDEYEVIAINDGSTDNSYEILLRYDKIYENLIVINNSNKGVGASRNLGVKIAKGEYVYFIDSDDFLEKDALSVICNEIKANNYDLISWGFNFVNDKGEYLASQCFKEIKNVRELIIYDWPVVWNKIFKREIIVNSKIKFPSSLWHQDLATIPFYVLESRNYKYINKCLYNYRMIRKGNITHSFGTKSYDTFKILDIIKNNSKRYSNYYKDLEFLRYYHGKANIRKWRRMKNSDTNIIIREMKIYLKKEKLNRPIFWISDKILLFKKIPSRIKRVLKLK